MRRLICLLALSILGSCSTYEPYVISTTQLGVVTQSTGFPSVLRNARPYILAERSALYPGDIITTDEQSLLELQLISGSVIRLGTRSQLLLREFSSSSPRYIHRFTLSSGSMEIENPRGEDNEFFISTRIATIESESSRFWLGYVPATNGVDVVSLSAEAVHVRNQDGSATLTAPFAVSSIIPGAAPQDALIWSEKRFDNNRSWYTKVSR